MKQNSPVSDTPKYYILNSSDESNADAVFAAIPDYSLGETNGDWLIATSKGTTTVFSTKAKCLSPFVGMTVCGAERGQRK